MDAKPIISLCMPTNGVIEWVFPTLDSIYNQGVCEGLFEVIVTDNGNNSKFETQMLEYVSKHTNIIYEKREVLPFINEIESYKLASGLFIKYINHRTMLLSGTLGKYISFINKNKDTKPIIYFSNGMIEGIDTAKELDSFDEYVKTLSYWSSWSTGMAFWKEDFDNIDLDINLDVLFPHTKILFNVRDRSKYIVDNQVYLVEQKVGDIPKAKYDLFYAFAVDYLAILLELRRDNCITTETFSKIKCELLGYVVRLYIIFCIQKKTCSYDLCSFKESMSVFYSKSQIRNSFMKQFFIGCRRKFFRILHFNTPNKF